MAKKTKARQLADYFDQFVAGARRNGVSDEQIRAVWAMMMSFSGYSFCKPHSASYARVSFQAAYLKIHFPAEFMAAVISNQGGFYSTFAYVSEARRLGVGIDPPDVHASQIRWQGGRGAMRVGLMAVKGLSADTMQRVLAQRERKPFDSAEDFFQRVGPDAAEARSLILAGALDSLAPDQSRAQLLWRLSLWQSRSSQTRRQANLPLFAEPALANDPPPLPADDPVERLRREFGVLGFLCDRHPMTLYDAAVGRAAGIKARDLGRHLDRNIRFAGWLITGKVVRTKAGDPMEFLTFEDETGVVETTFFPRTYDRFCHMMDYGRPFLLAGRVEQNWGALTLTVNHVQPLG